MKTKLLKHIRSKIYIKEMYGWFVVFDKTDKSEKILWKVSYHVLENAKEVYYKKISNHLDKLKKRKKWKLRF